MKVAIVDSDLIENIKNHRFPNLACMKISAWWKSLGADVELKLDYDGLEKYDLVSISKVFLDTKIPEHIIEMKNVVYGGTGFFYDKAPQLPCEIEHIMPDYNLYNDWVISRIEAGEKPKNFTYYTEHSIGFTTRGCVRQCEFCVNKNYKQSLKHSPIEEFVDNNRKYICLLDDNLLACNDWKLILESLINTNKKFQYKQGLDERLLTKERVDYIFNKSKWLGDYIFAFDNIEDKDIIVKKLKLIKENTENKRSKKFYVFCGFNHDDPEKYNDEFWEKDIVDLFERIKILMEHNCLPYIMRYKDYDMSPYKGMYITLARWCNQPSFFKKKSFREFCEAHIKEDQKKTPATMKYMMEFEDKHPEIAKIYFDMKWDN